MEKKYSSQYQIGLQSHKLDTLKCGYMHMMEQEAS